MIVASVDVGEFWLLGVLDVLIETVLEGLADGVVEVVDDVEETGDV